MSLPLEGKVASRLREADEVAALSTECCKGPIFRHFAVWRT